MRLFAIPLLLGLLMLAPRDTNAQCSMCRAALESSAEGQAIAAKFNRGILLLLGAPFSVVLVIGTALRRAQRQRAGPGRTPS